MFEIYTLIIFILSCYGGANGIVFSRLLQPLRAWIAYKNYTLDDKGNITTAVLRSGKVAKFFTKLVNCPLCVGFWLGVIFGIFLFSPCYQISMFNTGWQNSPLNIFVYLFDGFLGSASAWILHLLLRYRMEGA